MHFIFDLITKIIKGLKYGDEVVLWGNGYQKREIVYIDDFLNDLILLDAKVENNIVNIGAGEEYTIRDFASVISELVGYDKNLIKYDENRYVGAEAKFLDTNKATKIIGQLNRTDLKEGLSKTIKWIEKHLFE